MLDNDNICTSRLQTKELKIAGVEESQESHKTCLVATLPETTHGKVEERCRERERETQVQLHVVKG